MGDLAQITPGGPPGVRGRNLGARIGQEDLFRLATTPNNAHRVGELIDRPFVDAAALVVLPKVLGHKNDQPHDNDCPEDHSCHHATQTRAQCAGRQPGAPRISQLYDPSLIFMV